MDHAVAALAINEAYGLTGSPQFKSPAQASVHALVSLQVQDGSWGDGTTTAWAADALKSAELSDLPFSPSAYEGLRGYYDRRAAPDAREMIARIQMDRNKLDPRVAAAASAVAASPPVAGRPIHDLYLSSRAIFQYDGPDGALWKSWNEPFRECIRAGAFNGRIGGSEAIVQTSLSALSLEVYYRYANVFGAK